MKQTILITGGTGKIGRRLCLHFAEQGHRVIFTSTKKEKAEQLCEEAGAFSENLVPILADFTDPDAIINIISLCQENDLWPDTLVNNARNIASLRILPDGTSHHKDLMDEYALAVVIPYRLTMELKSGGLRNVIFVSSIYGVVAPTPSLYSDFQQSSPVQYGTAKAAQIHLTKELAVRLAPEIRVNCLSLGGIQGRVDDSFLDRYEKLTPLNKMLTVDDVVDPMEFLVSNKSANMTGQNVIVDGGWTIW